MLARQPFAAARCYDAVGMQSCPVCLRLPPPSQAVEFVQLQRDDELWEQLIALTLGDAQLTGKPFLLGGAGCVVGGGGRPRGICFRTGDAGSSPPWDQKSRGGAAALHGGPGAQAVGVGARRGWPRRGQPAERATRAPATWPPPPRAARAVQPRPGPAPWHPRLLPHPFLPSPALQARCWITLAGTSTRSEWYPRSRPTWRWGLGHFWRSTAGGLEGSPAVPMPGWHGAVQRRPRQAATCRGQIAPRLPPPWLPFLAFLLAGGQPTRAAGQNYQRLPHPGKSQRLLALANSRRAVEQRVEAECGWEGGPQHWVLAACCSPACACAWCSRRLPQSGRRAVHPATLSPLFSAVPPPIHFTLRVQMCLQQGCNTILRHDCVVLANRLYRWAVDEALTDVGASPAVPRA